MTSRLQILNYCWRCQQNGNQNFRSHIYTNCMEINMSDNSSIEESGNEEENESSNEEESDNISWNYIFHDISDVFYAENYRWVDSLDFYFSDNDDSESESESENNNEEIDINNLMFAIELTKTKLDMCAICFEENIKPDDTTTLDCNHTFCNPCLSRIILNCNLVCALCRTPINLKNI